MQTYKRFIVNVLASNNLVPNKLRYKLYSLVFKSNIRNSEIRSGCFFNSEHVSIGKDSFVNNFCQFHASYLPEGSILIGEKCFIAMNVTFIAVSHVLGDSKHRAGANIYNSISVGNGCWIGANTTILPGVSIGEGVVIAAGSVVIEDCEPNSLYAGNPAVKKKDLT